MSNPYLVSCFFLFETETDWNTFQTSLREDLPDFLSHISHQDRTSLWHMYCGLSQEKNNINQEMFCQAYMVCSCDIWEETKGTFAEKVRNGYFDTCKYKVLTCII